MTLLMILLFLMLVVLRVSWHYHLTGDHGIRPVSRQAPNIAKFSSALLVTVFSGQLILSIVNFYGALVSLITPGFYGVLAGILICLTGIGLMAYSQFQMGKSWRMGVDATESTALVVDGVYAYVRHPIYSGVMIFELGLIVLLPHTLMIVLGLLGLIAIDVHVKRVEEPYLHQLHGLSYERYKQTTGRYWPTWGNKNKSM